MFFALFLRAPLQYLVYVKIFDISSDSMFSQFDTTHCWMDDGLRALVLFFKIIKSHFSFDFPNKAVFDLLKRAKI